jgi:ribosomal protein S25
MAEQHNFDQLYNQMKGVVEASGNKNVTLKGIMGRLEVDFYLAREIGQKLASENLINPLRTYTRQPKPETESTPDPKPGSGAKPALPVNIKELYPKVKAFVIQEQKASASMIQKRFGTGQTSACRLLRMLHNEEVIKIGPHGSTVLIPPSVVQSTPQSGALAATPNGTLIPSVPAQPGYIMIPVDEIGSRFRAALLVAALGREGAKKMLGQAAQDLAVLDKLFS